MKKVLIIANLFHATPRIPGLSTYLVEYGWQVTIITPPIGENYISRYYPPQKFFKNVKIIEVPYKGDIWWFWRKILALVRIRKENGSLTEQIKTKIGSNSKNSWINKIMYFYEAVFGFPDSEKYWIKPVMEYAKKNFKKDDFKVVLSSAPYFASHIAAKKTAKVLKIPWVADYRDCWSQNPNYTFGIIRKFFDQIYEKRLLRSAMGIIGATPSVVEKQAKFLGQKAITILNGFDPVRLNVSEEKIDEKFTLIYTGRLYVDKQDPEKFLLAVKDLLKENLIKREDLEIVFYGEKQIWLDKMIFDLGLDLNVRQEGIWAREKILKIQKSAQVLLLFGWEGGQDLGVFPKKTFEYLSAGRPILVCGGAPKEGIKEIIREVGAGLSAVSIEEIKSNLLNLYQEYRETGVVAWRGNLEKIRIYSYYGMAEKFAKVLNEIDNNKGKNK